MKKRLIAAASAFGAILGLSSPAFADEQWTSGDSTIVYEIDDGDMAVFSVDGMRLYIDGLAGVTENRGSYHGIWMLDEAPVVDAGGDPVDGCGFSMLRPDDSGEVSEYWGQVEITFIDAEFPSVWIGYFGDCFDGASETMIARPLVGQ
ncbi:MAG: hypothetical protein ABJG15_14930 [Hyphomonadaceae bacterium]